MKTHGLTRREMLRVVVVGAASMAVASCGATPTATPVPPTATKAPAPPPPTATTQPPPPATKAPVIATPAAAAPKGQVVVVQSGMDIVRNIHPNQVQYEIGHTVSSQVQEGLLGFTSKDLSYYPRLAKSYKTLDGGKTLAFELREGIKFSNGMDFTADDVKYGLESLMKDQTAMNGYKSTVTSAEFKEVKVTGPLSVEISFGKAYTPVLEALCRIYYGPKALYEKEPETLKSAYARAPIGTGPYKVVDHAQDDVVLEARTDYWGDQKPQIGKVVFRATANNTASAALLKSGEADIGQFSAAEMTGLDKEGFVLQKSPSLTFRSLYIDHTNPILSNKLVRQALMHALNRDAIIKDVLLGWSVIGTQMIPPNSPWYNPKVKTYEFDPKKATEILNGVGWRKGSSGVLQKDGQPFKLEIEAQANNKEQMDVAQFVQQQWKDIGVDATIYQTADSSAKNNYLTKTQRGVSVFHTGITTDPVISINVAYYNGGSFGNRGYKNSELDDLLDKAAAEFDADKKKALLWRVEEIMAEDVTDFWIGHNVSGILLKPKLKGITLMFGPGSSGWMQHVNEWYWES